MNRPKFTLLLVSLNQFLTWGILYYSFSVMIIPFQEAYGWAEAVVSGGFSSALLVTGVLSVPIGFLLDRIGPKPIIRIGTLLAPVLLALIPLVTEVWQYYTIWLLIGVSMSLILYEPALKLVSQLPLRHEKSYAFLTMVAGVSGVVFAPFGEFLVRQFGYQQVIWFYALLMLLLVAPSNFIATNTPFSAVEKKKEKPSFGWILHSDVLRFLTGIFFNTFSTASILVIGVVWLTKAGQTQQFGAIVLGLIGFMSLPARLFVTQMHKFSTGYHAFSLLVGLQLTALIIALFTQSMIAVTLFAIVFGFSLGAITPLRAVLTQQEFGHLGLGGVNGIIAFVTTMARSIGPLIGAYVLQSSDSTLPFSFMLVGSSTLSFLLMLSMLMKKADPLEPILEVEENDVM
ncbi:MFS transporter [bacterium]|nr:MAG: MFS transporter [bacterium]